MYRSTRAKYGSILELADSLDRGSSVTIEEDRGVLQGYELTVRSYDENTFVNDGGEILYSEIVPTVIPRLFNEPAKRRRGTIVGILEGKGIWVEDKPVTGPNV